MQRSTLRRLAASSLTLGSAFAVLGGFPDRLGKYVDVQAFWYDILLIAGIALIVLAGLLFSGSKFPRISSVVYGIAAVEPAALRNVYAFILTILDDVASFEVFRSWYEKNPDIIQAVIKISSSGFGTRQELAGFFSVFPMTDEARALLESNELLGAAFTAAHICEPSQIPAAYYIGAVGGVGRRGRHATLLQLMGYVTALQRRHTKLVFTRPMTEDGLRLARDYRFSPVRRDVDDPKNTIYVRDFARDPTVV